MRCVSYTRYTSCIKNKEIPSNTILLQNQNIERYARARKWVIRKKYADRKRDLQSEDAFLEMQKDGMARQFDMLVCDSLDHLGVNRVAAMPLAPAATTDTPDATLSASVPPETSASESAFSNRTDGLPATRTIVRMPMP